MLQPSQNDKIDPSPFDNQVTQTEIVMAKQGILI